MAEYITNRAKTIKTLIVQNLPNGADLLIDFARQYAIEKNLEDEIILVKLEYHDQMITAKKEELIQKLHDIADSIVDNYDEKSIEKIFKKEKALVAAYQKTNMPNQIMVTAKQIEKIYKKSNFHLFLDSLELRLGEITGLIGENATGKTTLLRILAGDLAKDGGELSYPLFSSSSKLDWWAIKKQIAYVPQELPKWHGSLRENLKHEAAVHGIVGKENEDAVEYILQRLGLAPHVHKSWNELSGGYKLRFSLAKALVWKSQLLIIDEPLANLDIKTQIIVLRDLQSLVKSIYHPISILITSQHLHEIEAVADQLLFMRGGKLENLGKAADFRKERNKNVFEVNCTLSYGELIQEMEGFPYHKIIFNGIDFLITTATEIEGFDLIRHFAEKNIPLQLFRDISQSVKTKFYEQDIG